MIGNGNINAVGLVVRYGNSCPTDCSETGINNPNMIGAESNCIHVRYSTYKSWLLYLLVWLIDFCLLFAMDAKMREQTSENDTRYMAHVHAHALISFNSEQTVNYKLSKL